MSLDPQTLKNIENYDGEQRYKYFMKTVASEGQLWILTDEHGNLAK